MSAGGLRSSGRLGLLWGFPGCGFCDEICDLARALVSNSGMILDWTAGPQHRLQPQMDSTYAFNPCIPLL